MSETDGAAAVGGTAPVETTPGAGGLAEASANEASFSLSDEIMSSDFEEVEVPKEPTQTEPEVPAGEVPKAVEAKPEAAKAPAVEAARSPTPAEKPVQAPSSQPLTPPAGGVSLLEELAKNREQLISHLAETRFKPTKEENDLLDVDASAGIAKIAARVYYEAATTTMQQLQNFIQQQLPSLIDSHSQTTFQIRDAEDTFYREFPNLSREADDAVVRQYANVYRAANPSASRADAIRAVGVMVSTVLNKPIAAQAAVPSKNGGRATPRPFTPASGAARVVQQAVPAVQQSPWAGMGMDLE